MPERTKHYMLTHIAVTLLGGFIAFICTWIYFEDKPWRHDKWQHLGGNVFTGICVGAVVGFIVAALIGWPAPRTWQEKERLELYGISNSLGTTGSGGGFLVLYLRIDSQNTFTYWYPVGEDVNGNPVSNAYRAGTLMADALVVQEQRSNGVLITYEYECNEGFFSLWHYCLEDQAFRYTFYVPEGTVSGTYQLD